MSRGREPRRRRLLVLALAVAASLVLAAGPTEAALVFGFYNATCPIAEGVVFAEMRAILQEDPTLAPSLLRMHYHDCFVQGCDASVMLRSRRGAAERDATPNRSMRGYDAIERIKARLEMLCPLTVSCADIIAMAARDAVHLSQGPWYEVETGRRDGNVTVAEYAANDLAPPDSNIVDVKTFFSVKSLNSKDIAVLFGTYARIPSRSLFSITPFHFASRADDSNTLANTPPSLSQWLRVPQHRHVPLRGVPEAALQLHGRHGPGPVAGRRLREEAQAALPARRRPGQDQGAHRPRQRLRLRPQLLPPRAPDRRPLPVRRQPPPRRRHQGIRREDGQRVVARRVLQGLRRGDGQDGPHRRARRPARGGQGHLRRFC
ncbi:unnamed protein product [Alopecurus aequalis]